MIKAEDWYNLRYMDYIPEHFIKFKLNNTIKRFELITWIEKNTTGRFAISKDIESKNSFILVEDNIIGFENSEDAMIFTLRYS